MFRCSPWRLDVHMWFQIKPAQLGSHAMASTIGAVMKVKLLCRSDISKEDWNRFWVCLKKVGSSPQKNGDFVGEEFSTVNHHVESKPARGACGKCPSPEKSKKAWVVWWHCVAGKALEPWKSLVNMGCMCIIPLPYDILHLHICLSSYRPVHPSIHPSIFPSIHVSIFMKIFIVYIYIYKI